MAITPEVKRTARKVSLGFLLKILDQEWEKLQASVEKEPWNGHWQSGLLPHYFAGVHVALHWIDGDPYTYKFPPAYQQERLARLCAYLQKMEALTGEALFNERDKQVTLLSETVWPGYAEVCVGMGHEEGTGDKPMPPELTYTWEGVDSLWSEHEPAGPMNEVLPYLPKFHSKESEAFHCCALAVLFLNRACKCGLADLDVTPF